MQGEQVTEELLDNLEQSGKTDDKNLADRLWMDTTMSQFDDLLRINYDKTIEVFTDIIIAAVCEKVDAVSGSFFVVDEQEEMIKATAGYGCTLESMPKTEFFYGEGIIGQVVKSKSTKYLDDIPHASVMISSSLGNVCARSLICLPLIFNDRVYGVIELISLADMQKKYRELLERLCKNIASTLQSIQTNQKTKELLIKLQEETEERAAQEEELRQNLEELEATQEQLERNAKTTTRNNARLEAILHSSHDGIVTLTTDYIIDSVNPATTKIFGYEVSEMVGQPVNMLLPDDYALVTENKILGRGRMVTSQNKKGKTIQSFLNVNEVNLDGEKTYILFFKDIKKELLLKEEIDNLRGMLKDVQAKLAACEQANKP